MGPMFRIGGSVLALSLLAGFPACQTLSRSTEFRDLYIVAHEDDDLLFMNPDIQTSIADGHRVQTVYLTAGDGCRSKEYWEAQREAGVKAAYAEMAGVADRWVEVTGRVKEFRLLPQRNVSLVFFRLPSPAKEDGTACAHGKTLEKLWNGDIQTLSPLDGSSTSYTKQGLIQAVAAVVQDFHPSLIHTLDGSGKNPFPCSPGNPARCRTFYPAVGREYIYDHTDHYHAALFAREAAALSVQPYRLLKYRGYNIALEKAANLPGTAIAVKQNVFETYAEHDDVVADDPPFDDFYQLWLQRQYVAP